MGLLKILGKGGDREIPWDPADPQQLAAVRCGFETLLSEGYQAYSLDDNGRTGEHLRQFNPDASEIVLAPRFRGG
jgi:hypothetical protein